MGEIQKFYKNCLIQSYEEGGLSNLRGDVRFDGNSLIVSYTGNDKGIWRGSALTPGHYVCKRESGSSGNASLHQFQGGTILEGYWELLDADAGGADGMWRITLGELLKAPEKGEAILISDGEKWVKQKVTAFKNNFVSTKDFEDVKLADIGATWKFPTAKKK